MNKPLSLAAVAAVVALAYPASAWYLGQRIESAHAEQYAAIAELPYLRVVERDYQRGIFSATEKITLELAARPTPAAEHADGAEAAAPLRLSVLTRIQHGPLPGLSTLAAGVADSELELSDETGKEIAAVLGDKKPLTAHAVYGFDGGGKGTLTSPAFSATVPGKESGETTRITWEGVSLDVDFSAGMKQYSMRGGAPKLEIEETGSRLVVTGLAVEGKQQRVFDDDALFYAGNQKFSIAEVRIEPRTSVAPDAKPVLLQQVTYDVDAPVAGDFMDIAARVSAAVVKIDEQNYGPAHYDLSFKHLHSRTLAKLSRELMKLYSDPTSAAANENDPTAALAVLSTPGLELLAHAPELSLDRISFNSPHGEAKVAARIKLDGIKPDEFSNAFALIGKIDASGEASLPLALLLDWQGSPAQAARFQQQLAAMTTQGYVSQEGGLVKSAVVFRQGQLSVNGKPFNPLALGALGSDGHDHAHGHDHDHEDDLALEEVEGE